MKIALLVIAIALLVIAFVLALFGLGFLAERTFSD